MSSNAGLEKKNKEGRQIFLDELRIIACAAVVLMHTVSGVLNGGFDMTGYERRICAFRAIIDATAWCVPIFLIISGYLLLDPGRRVTLREAVFQFGRRIFLALVLFGVPYSLIELVGRERAFRPGMLWQAVRNTAIMKSWAHMWYLYLILGLYLITPLLKLMLEKLPKALLVGCLVLLVSLCSLLPFAEQLLGFETGLCFLPREGIYLFYYIMGYMWAIRKKEGLRWEGPLCLGIFAVILIAELGSRFITGYEVDMAYAYPPTLLASLLLFDGCRALDFRRKEQPVRELPGQHSDPACGERGAGERELSKKGLINIIVNASRLTFGIYLIHPVFLNFFYKYKGLSPMNFRFFIGVPLFFGIAFLGAAVVTYFLRRIPVLRKYVL